MNRMHQDLLTSRLEDASSNGVSHITWNELYLWYGVERIAAKTWRDLQERWNEVNQGTDGELMKIQARAGMYIFGKNLVENLADP